MIIRWLIEDDLINKYDISSRTPLREALTQLQAEGFVEYVPNLAKSEPNRKFKIKKVEISKTTLECP